MKSATTEFSVHEQPDSRPLYSVSVAKSSSDIEACQKLRFRVFAEELGARLKSQDAGIDQDEFDAHCVHLLVRNNHTGEVIATTRVLTEVSAADAGGFYSETEFYMASILSLPGTIMEIGRTCIAVEHRTGAALNALWQGVAQQMRANHADFLIGCVSIPATDGGRYALSVMEHIRQDHLSPPALRVHPHIHLPNHGYPEEVNVVMPRLLKTYLHCGAQVCGELYWDTDFNVADAFILLDRRKMNLRYARHFLGINTGINPGINL